MSKKNEQPTFVLGVNYKDREGRTWCNVTLYNGESYKARVVKDKDGRELLIGNDEILNTIHPGEWGGKFNGYDPSAPDKAEFVDGMFFFFTDDTTFNYSDADLRKDMAEENPEWFD